MISAKVRGFSLPELLTTLTIIAISTSLAIPSFTTYIQNNAALHDINIIKKLIYQARTTAIRSGTHTTICVLTVKKICNKQSDWKGIISTFIDINRNGKVDTSDQVIQTTEAGKNSSSIKWRAFNNRGYLQFSPLGLSTISNGTFTYCSKANKAIRQLVMNRQGRLKIRETPLKKNPC